MAEILAYAAGVGAMLWVFAAALRAMGYRSLRDAIRQTARNSESSIQLRLYMFIGGGVVITIVLGVAVISVLRAKRGLRGLA